MTVSERATLFAALRAALEAAPGGWTVWKDLAPAKTDYPYIVYFVAAASDTNTRQSARNPEYVVGVKAVHYDNEVAAAVAQEIVSRLRNKGDQDVSSGYLWGSSDWRITTTQVEEHISLFEQINGQNVYSEGCYVRVTMQSA